MNSMDSVDSGCTMGASEGHSNHAASSSAELVVWEIEVPKVSRRTGADAAPAKAKAALTPRLCWLRSRSWGG